MTAEPVLAELERVRRNEQIKKWDENESALAKRLVDQLAQDFAELGRPPEAAKVIKSGEDVEQADNFINWCKQKEVRSLPAKPSTVAAYVREYREQGDRVLTKLSAIAAMHDGHGLANPCHTAVVRSVLETMFKDEAPRSWTPEEKRLFLLLPIEVRTTIVRRERDREKNFRRMQNVLADIRKEKRSNAESKNGEPKGTERTSESSGASPG